MREGNLTMIRAPVRFGLVCLTVFCTSRTAWAHVPDDGEAVSLWSWSADPWTLVSLLLAATLYQTGYRRLRARSATGRKTVRTGAFLFWGGWAVAAIALVSPIDSLGSLSFTAHMIQHELLMLVAAPLIVLSRPAGVFAWSLPASWRPSLAGATRALRTPWRAAVSPGSAWILHALVLWGWHHPALFGAALTNDAFHAAQHLSFMAVALLFWWSLFRPGTETGWAFVSVFTTAVHSSALGAFLTFSPTVWYAPYLRTTEALALTPLQDQQIGGLVMWVPGGAVYLAAGLALIAIWLHGAQRRNGPAAALRLPAVGGK